MENNTYKGGRNTNNKREIDGTMMPSEGLS